MTDHVRPCDMWGFTESQETVHVSPRMYEEFVFPHEKPIMDRFGLTCYGCCEPLHGRWNAVKRHHNLRRVSCSAWVNVDKMVEALGDKYIFSFETQPGRAGSPGTERGVAPRRAARNAGEDQGLRRRNHHEGQPYAWPIGRRTPSPGAASRRKKWNASVRSRPTKNKGHNRSRFGGESVILSAAKDLRRSVLPYEILAALRMTASPRTVAVRT